MIKTVIAGLALALAAPMAHAAQGHVALAAGTISPTVPTRATGVSAHVTVFRRNGELRYRVNFTYTYAWDVNAAEMPAGMPSCYGTC